MLIIVILLRTIWDFKEFDLIYLLTGGGPVTSTQTLPLARLQAGLRRSTRWAGGRAIAVLMMLVMLVFMVGLLSAPRGARRLSA